MPKEPVAVLPIENGLAWCWVAWALKPGEALLVAVATSEEIANGYEPLVQQHYPGCVFHVEKAPVDHSFGASNLRAVASRAALRSVERRRSLISRPQD